MKPQPPLFFMLLMAAFFLSTSAFAQSSQTRVKADDVQSQSSQRAQEVRRCEGMERREAWQEAGACYEGVYLDTRELRGADELLMRAAANYRLASQPLRALHMLREVVNVSPRSQWLPDAVFGLCKGYDELKHRRGVTAWCGHFVERYPSHVNVKEAAERLERWEHADPSTVKEL